MRLLATILCLVPMLALADYPDPKRKQDQVVEFTRYLDDTPGQIVITGSSSIRRWRSIQDDLAPAKVIPTGIPGSNMNDLHHFLDELVLRFKPSAVVIYQGDNDTMIDRVSVDDVAGQFDEIVERTKKALPGISIYVMSVKPSPKNWAKWSKSLEINRRLAARANELDYLEFIDVATSLLGHDGRPQDDLFLEDGVHLSDKGYRVWTSILQPILAAHP